MPRWSIRGSAGGSWFGSLVNHCFIRSFLPLCISIPILMASGAPSDPGGKLQGVSSNHSVAQREWETKYRATISAENIREFDKRLSARPHHVGSPYDKDNAEWILANFKQWGYDAHIETFDAPLVYVLCERCHRYRALRRGLAGNLR